MTLRRTGGRRAGTTVPYRLDPWTGEVVRIARYTEADGEATVRVALQPGQATIVALGRPDSSATAPEPGRTSSTRTPPKCCSTTGG